VTKSRSLAILFTLSVINTVFALLSTLVMLVGTIDLTPAGAQGGIVRQISPSGTTSFQSAALDPTNNSGPELDGNSGDAENQDAYTGAIINRTIAKGHGNGASVNSGKKAKSNPELNLSVDGLNLYQQRYANGGNQFTVEPPDQGLCAGNGFVLESVNDVLRVFHADGTPATGVVDLNTFYGYPAAINRSNGKYGPSITDPSCLFDPDTQRWFNVVLTLDRRGTSSVLAGPNHLDIAVSQTADPTGAWTIFRVPAQNNGTDGTPDHGCVGGYCLGDYPHIGADANGFYISTNEFDLFGPNYQGTNIYAFSKHQLAAGGPANMSMLFTTELFPNVPAFTVWPAVSPAGQFRSDNGGTEFLLSSDAVFYDSGASNTIWQWSLTNTSSLDTAPALNLTAKPINVNLYGVPDYSNQKVGNYPVGQYYNDPLPKLDSNDSRMQQVFYANGKLWGALDTALTVNNTNQAGIAYYVINPGSSKVVKQGYLGLAGNNLTYPAVAVTPSGRGVIAFTVTGNDYYPSAGYASLDALVGAGDVHLAAAGAGPWDGFTGYPQYSSRPRWGDYGAAAVDGNSIWFASEYVITRPAPWRSGLPISPVVAPAPSLATGERVSAR
jgi:hypothetical protein